MVGIVVVSHSARLAEGVVELAREMAGPDVPIEAAGGLDEPGRPLGTDAVLVLQAIERAGRDGGEVLVLMDLGSAVLSAETALELMPEADRERVRLCPAPLAEGAVAAAVTARLGGSVDEVAAEAAGGLAGKVAHLGDAEPAEPGVPASAGDRGADWRSARVTVAPACGLHARPAARVVAAAGALDAEIELENLTAGRGPAPAQSITGIYTLGALRGHEVLVRARGPEADRALAELREILEDSEAPAPAAAPAPPARPAPADAGPPPEPGETLRGVPAAPGRAVGPAHRLGRAEVAMPEERAGDPAAEVAALGAALAAARAELEAIRADLAGRGAEDEAAILDAHLLLLDDVEVVGPARRQAEAGRSAAWAWRDAADSAAERFEALDDEYLRARAADVREVGRRVLGHLAGAAAESAPTGPAVVVADELGPAETAALDPVAVRALVTAAGGATSHSAILARALGLPCVAGLGPRLLAVPDGTSLLVDGDEGTVVVSPGADLVAAAEAARRRRAELERAAAVRAGEPAVTRDGVRIEVVANVGAADEAAAAVAAGAEGVGLLRTEFLFLGRPSEPDEEEQRRAYAAVGAALGERPRLILRTLDAGADKPVPYLGRPAEDNPFLGVRGIRLTLARPDLLVAQLRAALRVAADRPLQVMFPMVAVVEEVRAARAFLERARGELAGEGVRVPEWIETGVMVEVPAAALQAERLAAEVDFLSIGTNDLTQYVMAAERGNAEVARLLDALQPSVLALVARVTEAAERAGRWVGVCGEAAGDPTAVPVLVGLGVRELSASAPAIPLVKEAVRGLDLAAARALAAEALGAEDAAAVRRLVRARLAA
jgi:phosphocarrier protein FPr